jgi:hypothetical protein
VTGDQRSGDLLDSRLTDRLAQDEPGVLLVRAARLVDRKPCRAIGTGPGHKSACVVPRIGISSSACAQAVAHVEWVCTIPPISGHER